MIQPGRRKSAALVCRRAEPSAARALLGFGLVLTLLAACGARSVETGGETNWLTCEEDKQCPSGDCNAGRCTPLAGNSASPPPAPEPQISEEQFARAEVAPTDALLADDTGGAWRVIEVPAASNEPTVIQSPLGWLALSSRSLGGKAVTGYQSVLYRSADGVQWQSLPLQGGDEIALGGLAYGNGRYVMTGRKLGAEVVFWHSTDAEHWTEIPQGVDSTLGYRELFFIGERFIALGSRYVGVSQDGVTWSHVLINNVQPMSIVYGNGRYVLVGSGPVQVSEDGATWQSIDVPCSLPGACGTDPSGMIYQGVHYHVVFADGRFYAGQLSSEDGITWRAESHPSPAAYTSGRFLSDLQAGPQLQAWSTGGEAETLRVVRPIAAAQTESGRALTSIGVLAFDAEFPPSVNTGFDDGLTCETAGCVLVGSRLLLVPPANATPLADRVPRAADNQPLLSADCPTSSQLTCDDYSQRSGCVCDPEAPHNADYCADVGKYVCEGAFTPRSEEWPLGEVAQAACNCDYVDPNQPATFGESCTEGDATCAAPLECRTIVLPPSGGPVAELRVCTSGCASDADCPTWTATGFCSGEVQLDCVDGTCQPRDCE